MFKLVMGFALVTISSNALGESVPASIRGVAPATEQSVSGVAPATDPSERRLTPQQVDAILSENAKRKNASTGALPAGTAGITTAEASCPNKPHGQMGVEMGTGGDRAMYGSAVIPLSCNASIAVGIGASGRDGSIQRVGGRR